MDTDSCHSGSKYSSELEVIAIISPAPHKSDRDKENNVTSCADTTDTVECTSTKQQNKSDLNEAMDLTVDNVEDKHDPDNANVLPHNDGKKHSIVIASILRNLQATNAALEMLQEKLPAILQFVQKHSSCQECHTSETVKVNSSNANEQHKAGSSRKIQTSQPENLVKTNIEGFVCRYCSRKLLNRTNLEAHERIHTKTLVSFCKFCGKGFAVPSSCSRHQAICTSQSMEPIKSMSTPHQNINCEVIIQKCHSSDTIIVTPAKTKQRNGQPAADSLKEKQTNQPENLVEFKTGRFVCKYCSKKLSTLITLKGHERSHTNTFVSFCKFCKRGYTIRNSCVRHQKTCTSRKLV